MAGITEPIPHFCIFIVFLLVDAHATLGSIGCDERLMPVPSAHGPNPEPRVLENHWQSFFEAVEV